MKLFHPLAELVLVLSGEYLLVCKAAVFDRQQRTVYMRVYFIEVYNEGGDVLLAVSAADKRIDILRPAFDVALPLDVGIVRPLIEIYLLRTERQFAHAVPEPPKMILTTVRYFGSSSPSLGSLIPRRSNISAIRSGILRLLSTDGPCRTRSRSSDVPGWGRNCPFRAPVPIPSPSNGADVRCSAMS